MYSVEMYQRLRRACHVDGLSIREAAKRFGVHRKTVKKALAFSVPPGYQRTQPVRRPKLAGFTGLIDQILDDDKTRPRKQHHTSKRIFERLREVQDVTRHLTSIEADRRIPQAVRAQPLHGNGPSRSNVDRHAREDVLT